MTYVITPLPTLQAFHKDAERHFSMTPDRNNHSVEKKKKKKKYWFILIFVSANFISGSYTDVYSHVSIKYIFLQENLISF